MFRGFGCHGRIDVGELPDAVARELEALPGDWLEYDADASAIVVRHVQPTSGAVLPTVVSELVRMLAAIPFELQEELSGGDLLIHTEEGGRLVRITVDPGGGLHMLWARPDYAGAEKRPFAGEDIEIEGYEHRLNGSFRFDAEDPEAAAQALQRLADTFEGLYPEGDFRATTHGPRTVEVTAKDVNLDVRDLLNAVQRHAVAGTLSGKLGLSSFREAVPERLMRLLFEDGEILVQRPMLWA